MNTFIQLTGMGLVAFAVAAFFNMALDSVIRLFQGHLEYAIVCVIIVFVFFMGWAIQINGD